MGEPFVHTLRVRYAECDVQGVVFNAHYLAYFDTSVNELWRAAYGSYQTMLDDGLDIVLAEARLRFRSPARFEDELELAVAVTHLGTTSLRTQHTIRHSDELLAEGELRHVMVKRGSAVKTPIPGWMRDGLAPWTVADQDPAQQDAAEAAPPGDPPSG